MLCFSQRSPWSIYCFCYGNSFKELPGNIFAVSRCWPSNVTDLINPSLFKNCTLRPTKLGILQLYSDEFYLPCLCPRILCDLFLHYYAAYPVTFSACILTLFLPVINDASLLERNIKVIPWMKNHNKRPKITTHHSANNPALARTGDVNFHVHVLFKHGSYVLCRTRAFVFMCKSTIVCACRYVLG